MRTIAIPTTREEALLLRIIATAAPATDALGDETGSEVRYYLRKCTETLCRIWNLTEEYPTLFDEACFPCNVQGGCGSDIETALMIYEAAAAGNIIRELSGRLEDEHERKCLLEASEYIEYYWRDIVGPEYPSNDMEDGNTRKPEAPAPPGITAPINGERSETTEYTCP